MKFLMTVFLAMTIWSGDAMAQPPTTFVFRSESKDEYLWILYNNQFPGYITEGRTPVRLYYHELEQSVIGFPITDGSNLFEATMAEGILARLRDAVNMSVPVDQDDQKALIVAIQTARQYGPPPPKIPPKPLPPVTFVMIKDDARLLLSTAAVGYSITKYLADAMTRKLTPFPSLVSITIPGDTFNRLIENRPIPNDYKIAARAVVSGLSLSK